ncbi:UDP-2,3-diacylglucosamine hydrolase [Tatumella ptyseos]|uniref:UDP-2,3-diacylglucosamine hydrolase n=1 Tax=Tatumella ptyseos TaxID=82987 RepID=A0A2X5NLE7_9GAMM|nr:UDP-2,3-diacylglucosamine hydrolase [Tatumella ptyseos]
MVTAISYWGKSSLPLWYAVTPEEQLLELYGHRVLIMHGDTLCTDDAGYLRFREKVHQPWLQRLFLMLPLRLRQKIAVRLRNDSQQANQTKSQQIMDVNPQAVEAVMQRYQASLLIHGHTHRPAIHRLSVGQQPAERPSSVPGIRKVP